MDSLTLQEAKNKRAHVRAAATRLKTYIDNYNLSQGSKHDVIEHKGKLSELWNQFEIVQSRIEALKLEAIEDQDSTAENKETFLDQQIKQRESFENPYFNVMSRYDAIIEQFNQSGTSVLSTSIVNNTASNVRESHIKLPKIDLPVFTGSYEDWYSYQDTFDKLIHINSSLTDIEKFHYLRSSLKDKAAEVIRSIEITTDNYQEAWSTIKERFDNKRWIVHKHIKAIFDAPSLSKENHNALRELLDIIFKHMRALKAFKRPTDAWDDLIIHIITSKLDSATSKAWEISIEHKDVPDLKSLTDFLSKHCQALEAISGKSSHVQSNANIQKYVNKHKTLQGSVSNVAVSNLSCPRCKKSHPLYHCETFLKLPIEKRIQFTKGTHICTNCLRSTDHQAKTCKSGSCRKCNKKHNTLLHLPTINQVDKPSSNSKESLVDSNKIPQPIVTQCASTHCTLNILLSTAIIHVYDSKNQPVACRALLDSGSQMNFITDELAARLQLKEQSFSTAISGVMQETFQAKRNVNLQIKSRFNNFKENIDCIILPKITQNLPQEFICTTNLKLPKHINLADPNFNVPSTIDILIGADLFWRIICAGQIRYSKNQPTLQKTLFGWIISGHMARNSTNSLQASNCHLAITDDLSRILSRFWEVDHNISSPTLTIEEQTCEDLFQSTVKRDEKGRFIVQLPLKTDKLSKIGDSKDIAMRRFKHLEGRLLSQPELYNEYTSGLSMNIRI